MLLSPFISLPSEDKVSLFHYLSLRKLVVMKFIFIIIIRGFDTYTNTTCVLLIFGYADNLMQENPDTFIVYENVSKWN